MDIYKTTNPAKLTKDIVLRFAQDDQLIMGNAVMRLAVEYMAQQVADEFLKEHFVEIMAKMDATAVANLAIADAGAAIHEVLQKKLPDKIVHRTETRTVERGFFGGIKRVY